MSLKLEKVSYSPSQPGTGLSPVGDISLEIAAGEFVGLMGASGSGKSSLLALFAGLARPDEGSVYVDGTNINIKAPRGAIMPVSPALLTQNARCRLFGISLERELNLSLKGGDLSKDERKTRVKLWLEKLGFSDEKYSDCSPLCLSEGEKQRLALASVMVKESPVLLLDEPFSGLDSQWKQNLCQLLAQLNRDGVTVIIASNDADVLAEYAGRIIVLERGRLVRDGSAKAVFTDYFELMRHEIPVPKVRMLSQRLRERDVNMPGNIILYEQFIDRLKIIMWRKEK